MPRPATLPIIDWKAIFDSGLDYTAYAVLPGNDRRLPF